MAKTIKDDQPRTYFDCDKCPAFCCTIYERVQVTKRDITRLAKHFGVSYETARRRYTKQWEDERVLKKVEDKIFPVTCVFLDQDKRNCTVYHARPAVCREYPDRVRCPYYDVLQFERRQQADDTVLPLFQITFREVTETNGNGNGEKKK
ncbi:MAG TPA: YkgJ family cysteine cluster protein [Pyrinomonadaceae bacterium]|jgi:Fe-S-cluster containining protein|nr:YkgJ family cysteine cluster protein [Pyrinomonadaceae bacterium]